MPGKEQRLPVRSRRELEEIAVGVNCGTCWARPGKPCRGGITHEGRYQRAYRKGFITADELASVVGKKS